MRFGEHPTKNIEIKSAQLLQNELLIRLSKNIRVIDMFPYGLCLMPSIRKIRGWYKQSFEDIYSHEGKIDDTEGAILFTQTLKTVYQRHFQPFINVGKGLTELKLELSKTLFAGVDDFNPSELIEIHQSLNEFFTRRIGVGLLIQQHRKISNTVHDTKEDITGIILKDCHPYQIIEDVVQHTSELCFLVMGKCPKIEIFGPKEFKFPYISSHIYFIISELLKNSLKATVDYHFNKEFLPSVKIYISGGNESLTIKVSDEGGGISRKNIKNIWGYMFTTSNQNFEQFIKENIDFNHTPILSGFGIGLPLSRVYANYFGGDLEILSVDGFGTDAYLFLNQVGDLEETIQ